MTIPPDWLWMNAVISWWALLMQVSALTCEGPPGRADMQTKSAKHTGLTPLHEAMSTRTARAPRLILPPRELCWQH